LKIQGQRGENRVAEHSEHIVSPKIYAAVLAVLLAGTYITVQAAKVDLGRWNIVLALSIAVTKMTLVLLFFMHGKYSARRTKLVIVSGFFWLAIMLALTLADYTTRHPEPSRSRFQAPETLALPGGSDKLV
jgi:cytochrome c oxidase subunit 4